MGWMSRLKSSRSPVEEELFFLTSLFIELIDSVLSVIAWLKQQSHLSTSIRAEMSANARSCPLMPIAEAMDQEHNALLLCRSRPNQAAMSSTLLAST